MRTSWRAGSRRSAPIARGLPTNSTDRWCKTRKLERTNREIAEKLDAAIGTIRAVLEARRELMSHINVTINGRQYRMACEEGQEVRLLKLAESLEARIVTLRGKFGEIGDARLTVMAALTACDELLDASNRIRGLEEELDALAQHPRRGRRPRPRHADRGRERAQRRRRADREDHAGPEPHHRRRHRDRVVVVVPAKVGPKPPMFVARPCCGRSCPRLTLSWLQVPAQGGDTVFLPLANRPIAATFGLRSCVARQEPYIPGALSIL